MREQGSQREREGEGERGWRSGSREAGGALPPRPGRPKKQVSKVHQSLESTYYLPSALGGEGEGLRSIRCLRELILRGVSQHQNTVRKLLTVFTMVAQLGAPNTPPRTRGPRASLVRADGALLPNELLSAPNAGHNPRGAYDDFLAISRLSRC
jgi:hypothetical protein